RQVCRRRHIAPGAAGPGGASAERILEGGRDRAVVAAAGEAAARGEDVLEGAAGDADLQHHAVEACLRGVVVLERQLGRSRGQLAAVTPPVFCSVPTRLFVAPEPTFCRQKLTVTVSLGSRTPLGGAQPSAVMVAPAATTTGVGVPVQLGNLKLPMRVRQLKPLVAA